MSVLILVVWLAIVCFVSTGHELWRDEVRALSIATEPSSILQLQQAIINEGHPIAWYLILRSAYAVVQANVAIKIASIGIAFFGVALFFRYSPFMLWQKILFIFGVFPFFLYSVMTRNYGISMLLFFFFATMYQRRKTMPLLLAFIIIALANTNVHSCILACVLASLWFYDDIVIDRHSLDIRKAAILACTLLLSGLGIGYSVVTSFPSRDSIVTNAQAITASSVMAALWTNIIHPGGHFVSLFPYVNGITRDLFMWILIIGLLIRPALSVALFSGVVLLGAFFSIGYPPSLRHEGILMMFVLTIYWLAALQRAPAVPGKTSKIYLIHRVCFYLFLPALFVMQIIAAIPEIHATVSEEESSSRAFGDFLSSHPEYHNAIILGEPDYKLESLPYYAPNRIYIPREEQYGKWVHFTTANKRIISLGEILDRARQISNTEFKPVLIALGVDLPQTVLDGREYYMMHGYNRVFTLSLKDLAAFKSQTAKVAEFKNATGDENYDIYRLL